MTKKVTIAMVGGGKPRLVLRAAADMGVPFTNPRSAAETILGLLLPRLADYDGEG